MLTNYAGLRVSEVAVLKYADVVAADCTKKAEFQLAAEQVKGGHARTVFVGEKLRKEEDRPFKRHFSLAAGCGWVDRPVSRGSDPCLCG